MNRFIKSQDPVYHIALTELRSGRKQIYWMWFIFPQIDGLGRSSTAQYYAIKDRDEAIEYLNHPVLGKRLIECTEAVLDVEERTVSEIFGYPDDMKFKSSMTLFSAVSDNAIFQQALDKYFDGEQDNKTLELLS